MRGRDDGDKLLTVGQKVVSLARQLGLPMPELAEGLGVNRSTPYSYTNPTKMASPHSSNVDRLIAYLQEHYSMQIPREWFFDGKEGSAPLDQPGIRFPTEAHIAGTPAAGFASGDKVLLPLWRGVLAGADGECVFDDESSPEYYEVPAFITGNEIDRHVVGVASGMSMHPRVGPGEHIVIRLDPNPPENAIVIARADGRGNFIKAYKRVDERRMQLVSLNPSFASITNLDDWQLRGYAIAILKTYEGGKPNIEWDFGRPLRA